MIDLFMCLMKNAQMHNIPFAAISSDFPMGQDQMERELLSEHTRS